METTLDAIWLVVEVNRQPLAFPCAATKEMVILPAVTEVPHVPPYVRGVINLRGQVLPVVDLRKRLGMQTAAEEAEELCALMRTLAQDHRRWLDNLLASVVEQRAFTCTSDPHACAFGRWYDSYHSDNLLVAQFLKRFTAPHQRLHALAGAVETLIGSGRREEAMQTLEGARGTVLTPIMDLFAEFETVVRTSRREIAIVLECEGRQFAVCVDGVESVEKLTGEGMEELGSLGLRVPAGICVAAAKRAKDNRPVLTLAAERILGSAGLATSESASAARRDGWKASRAA